MLFFEYHEKLGANTLVINVFKQFALYLCRPLFYFVTAVTRLNASNQRNLELGKRFPSAHANILYLRVV